MNEVNDRGSWMEFLERTLSFLLPLPSVASNQETECATEGRDQEEEERG